MWSDPEVFGGFLLVRRLAESRMAEVSLAVRLGDSSGRPIVVKRPPLGERASGRAAQAILREAEVLSAVRGAGLPSLEAAGDIAGLPYVGVERLRGASLAKVLALGEPLPAPAARAIGRDVGRALDKLHAAGWVHRDVTPSNLFVDEAGEAYLLDFGLCERAGDERGAPIAGTRGYAAPEAPTMRAAHPAQDVYGLAVCLAEATLGRRLFDETSLVEAAGRGDAPPQAAALEAVLPGITAALRRDPAARPTAADFASMLAHKANDPADPSGTSALAALAERAQAHNVAGATATPDAPQAPGQASPRQGMSPPPSPASSSIALAERSPSGVLVQALSPAAPSAFAASPRAVTPTVSMPAVVVREVPARDSGVVDTVRDLAPDAPPRGSASRRSGRAVPWQIALVVALVAIAIGFVSGRFSSRANRGGSSFAISGPLPKRAEVLLDSKKLTIADGVPMPLPAGSHTLTITTPKNPKREIPFTVRPGEHVVIVSPLRGSAQPDEEAPP